MRSSLERKRIKGIKCATCRQLYRTKHLKDKIKSEKTLYSAKRGVYYKQVVFKDEPNLTYIIQPIGTRKGILVEGFDTETKKSIKSAKHNYFNQNYKP